MNLRPSGLLTVAKAIGGFISYKNAEGLSPRTIDSYQRILQKWLDYLGKNKMINKISSADITKYLGFENALRIQVTGIPQFGHEFPDVNSGNTRSTGLPVDFFIYLFHSSVFPS